MTGLLHTLRRIMLVVLVQTGLACGFAMPPVFAAALTVTNNADTGAGSLRAAVTSSVTGDTIVFDCSAAALTCPATITLSSQGNNQGFPGPTALSISGKSITIQAPSGGDVTLLAAPGNTSATSLRLFFVDTDASLTLQNLTLSGGKAIGGKGGGGGGGGAAGLGGGIFSQGSLILNGVTFSGNGAFGGGQTGFSGNGSGGLGGDAVSDYYGGGGGTGGNAVTNGVGGPGLGGTGGGISGGVSGAGSNGTGGGGGGGGFSGGGSASDGGGGGGAINGYGGNGGFGGGGGGAGTGQRGMGGFGGGGGGAGTGGVGGGFYGGGAAFGGAVFARNGTLNVANLGVNGGITSNSLTAGIGANGSANGATAGSGLFLMHGVTTTLDIAGTYSVSDTIADDSATSLPGTNPATYTPGSIANPGAAITKQGTGTLTLSGPNTYAGATMVNNGILRVTGSIAGAATVAASGILTGDGATGAVDSFGTLAPGTIINSQGTLTAKGLTLEAGSLSCFHALGSSNATSHLVINGTANVNGIARIDFASRPSTGTMYTLLQVTSVSGTFAGFETNMSNVNGTLAYNATTVTFTVTSSDVLFQNGFEVPVSPCAAAFAG